MIKFHKRPTKEELDNLPLTKVYYDCDEEFDENFKNSNITELSVSSKYNGSLSNLPQNLEKLNFSYHFHFNQYIDISQLPSTLIHI